jgi:chemotaxis signal transduction protein
VNPGSGAGAASFRALLLETGEFLCALPIGRVRQVVRALQVHPSPGTAAGFLGLAEFAGEPIPVLDLGRLVGAPTGARPARPVTVIAWAGPAGDRQLVGLAADAALEIVEVAADVAGSGRAGVIGRQPPAGGRAVRVLDMEALGRP